MTYFNLFFSHLSALLSQQVGRTDYRHAWTNARTHACTHARTHACTHACTHARTHASALLNPLRQKNAARAKNGAGAKKWCTVRHFWDNAKKMVCASFSILTTWGSAHICVHSCTKYMNLAVLQQCVSSTFLRHFRCHLASF